MDFKFEQHVKVKVTNDLSKTILDILNLKKYKKPFIVVEKFLLDMPVVKEFFNTLRENSIEFITYDEVLPNPTVRMVDEGVTKFKENHCDSVIAIGGGSIIDTARGINVVRTLGGSSIKEYVNERELSKPCEGLISVPSTSGTGSELSNTFVITDEDKKEKLAVISDNAVSEFAVLYPKLTLTVPTQSTIATGLDAFTHALEGYTSTLSSPITDAICEKIMYLIVKYLPKVVKNGNDIEARERMMVAAAMGGWTMNSAGTHIGHSQAHILGAKYNITHGAACAYAAPGTIQYTANVEPKKIKEVGYILGAEFPEDVTDFEIGSIVSEKFRNFRDETLGLKPFSSYGISREEILSNIEEVKKEQFAINAPIKLDTKTMNDILEVFG
ncbi:iron-containing alcohol dehydrogenase [Tetragenococcus halophilus]|uniref:iron-containing alcohol dehydrogenase n=1 Tax=Tetragenococcus halophilus TaxID=51669 RepID=UPI00209B1CCC|nr:iron-containing alcohol dehydrogenase [Tetragenococcus halophilus]MCO8289758.1 iron-containing alcohol dehydrogenase [Tetragenococcus halophilus]MCO8294340.1 iron-containing alcohol dehydrogenase [Tetragenococcus halophilus]